MAKTPSKSKFRRSEVRRQRSESTEPLFRRLRDQVGFVRPAIGVGFFAAATLIVWYGQDPFPYRLGQEVRGPLYAHVEFGVTNEEETERRRREIREGSPNYYTLDEGIIERITGTISNLYTVSQAYESFEAYQAARSDAGEQAGDDFRWRLDQESFDHLNALAGETGKEQLAQSMAQLVDNLKRERLVMIGDDRTRQAASKSQVAVLLGALPNDNDRKLEDADAVEVDKYALAYFDANNLRNVNIAVDAVTAPLDRAVRPSIKQILHSLLEDQPLFKFDLERTLDEMEEDAQSGGGDILDMKYPNVPLAEAGPEDIERGGRYRLTEEQVKLLKYDHDKRIALLTAPVADIKENQLPIATVLRNDRRDWGVALAAVVLLIVLGMITYCAMFQPRVLSNPVRAISVALLFVVMLVVTRAAHLAGWTVAYPYITVAPVVMTAAILTMVYSQRFALGMTAALSLLIVLASRGDLGMLLVLVACASVAIYQLREIRSRNELFATGLLNALTAFVVGLLAWLINGHSLESALPQASRAAGAALVAIAIFGLILQPVERIFKVATNWTLFELLDTSKPLLSRLAREAPGTFAHSLWLSTMAESACEAVRANGLLAKVGAMYHDIGKVHKAEYFAENQEANINRHDNLAPTMSLLVIIGHVKDGIELAREEGLPPAVIRFIEEHHGTTLVRYFHHVATEQQKAAGNTRGVSESEFRYPGPKPQSKETAVLMLCDGVEGAVRALQEPTAGRIETVVHHVLMDRLTDGQFDECDITLKELHSVEDSLVKTLCRFYHGRVAYPKPTASEPPAEPVEEEVVT